MTPCPLQLVWLLSALHPLEKDRHLHRAHVVLPPPHLSPPVPVLHPVIVTDACTEPMVSLLSSSCPPPLPPLSADCAKPWVSLQSMCAGLQAQREGLAEQLLEGLHVPRPDGSHQEHRRPHGLPQRGAPNLHSLYILQSWVWSLL